MASKDTTAKFNVDISGLKKNIQEANRQIKLANAEFKAASAGMESWAKSTDGLTAKITQTQKVLESQKKILAEYEKQLELVEKEYGKNSKEADAMRIKVLNQEAAVKTTAAQLDKYEKELVEVSKAEKEAGKATEDQLSAYEKLDKSIKDQEKQLGDLKKEYAAVVLEQGKNSDAAKDLAKEIDTLSKELKEDKEAFEEAGKAADGLDNSLDDTGKHAGEAGDAAKKASDGFTVMKGVLADLAATAIKAVVQGLKDLASAAAESWQAFDEGRDTIIKLTGATGEFAEDLTKSYSNVSKNVLADSTDIGKAIGEVNTRWGLTGQELEKLSTLYLKFADITDADVISSIDDTQKALSAYGKGVQDADKFLDALAKTSQNTGVQTSTLTSGIISNATAFQEMGLSLDQAVVFMGQLEKSGTNSETVLNGMRKALKNSAKDGKSMNDALLDLQKQIESGANGMDGLNASYELFGKSGDQIYGAIKNGTLSFKDLTTAMNDNKGAVENTYEATMDATDRIKLQIQGLKTDFAEMIDGILQEYGPDIEELIGVIGEQLKDMIPALKGWLQELLPKIKEFIPTLETLIPEVISFFKDVVQHGHEIISVIGGIASALVASKIVSTVQSLLPIFTNLGTKVKELWTAFSGGKTVAAVFGGISGTVLAAVAAVAALIAAFVTLWKTNEDFRNSIMEVWNGLKEKVLEAGRAITEAINSLGFDFDNLGEVLKAVWKFLCNVLAPAFVGIFAQLSSMLGGVVDIIKGVIQVIVGIIKGFKDGDWSVFIEGLKSIFMGFINIVTAPFKGMFESFKYILTQFGTTWSATWEAIKAFVVNIITGILTGVQNLWNGITQIWSAAAQWYYNTVIQPITDFFSQMWEGIVEFASNAWDGICGIFEGAVDWFTKVFQGVSDAIGKIMNGVVGIVKKPINAMIRMLNTFIDGINKIQVPDWVPSVGGKGINIPHIRELEQGGVLKKGQMGLLEGNGAEAVVPLEKNKKWIAAVSADLRKSLTNDGLLAGANTTTTTYNFVQNNNSPKALDRLEIYRQTRNQLAFANGGGVVNV